MCRPYRRERLRSARWPSGLLPLVHWRSARWQSAGSASAVRWMAQKLQLGTVEIDDLTVGRLRVSETVAPDETANSA